MLVADGAAQQTPAATPSTPPTAASKTPAKKTTTGKAAPAPLTTRKQKFSYALGMNIATGLGANLKKQGVDVVWGPVTRPTFARAEICDPNGYRIELRQWF